MNSNGTYSERMVRRPIVQFPVLATSMFHNAAAPSLTLRSSPGQGMHVHVQKSKRNQAQINSDPLFLKLTEKGSTATYFHHVRSIPLWNKESVLIYCFLGMVPTRQPNP
jgi:hypothetical protein